MKCNKGILIIFILLLVLFVGCGKKEEVLTIGTEGGLIQSEEHKISLEIEPNAVSGTTELKIVPMEQENLMGPDQVTDFFTFEGLEQVNGKITFTIEVDKALSGETYAAVTVPANIKSEGIVADALIYILCDVTDNKVSFNLPMSPNQELVKNSSFLNELFNVAYADEQKSQIKACVLTNMKSSLTTSGKFKVIGSSSVREIDRETVEAYLEFLYKFYKDDLKFDKIEKYNGWPMTVTIRGLYPLIEGDYAGKGAAGFFYNFGVSRWIVINEDQLSQFKDIQKTLIHEMFHFVQSQYTSNTWFDEATAVWVEEYYKPNSGYIGDLYKKYGGGESQIMDGPINIENRNVAHHGYGSAAFVKYLTNRYGKDKLVAVYSAMPSGGNVDILSGIAPIKEWINDFYVKLLSREVYGATTPNVVTYKKDMRTVDVEVSTVINPDAIPVKEVIEIPPYGARAIYVDLQFEDPTKVSSSIILEGSAAPGLKLNWIYYGAAETKVLITGTNELGLSGLDKLSQTKHILGLLMTNETNDFIETDVTFEVKNIPPLNELVGTWTDLSALVNAVDLHPELEQLIANPPEEGQAIEGGEFFTEFSEGCEFMTAEAIYELLKGIKEMEGMTYPSEFVITQNSETEGTLLVSLNQGEGMSPMGDPLPFKYEDGIMSVSLSESEDGNVTKMDYSILFAYEKENIVCNGISNLSWESEGQQVLNLNFIYNGKILAPKTTP